jgi:drug/metabolite transporter (DMT)-like permease
MYGALVGFIILLAYSQLRKDDIIFSLDIKLQKTYLLQGFLLSTMLIAYLSSISIGTPIGEVALLVQIHPIITLLLARIFVREQINVQKILALLIALLGLVILTQPWEKTFFLSSVIGDLLAISIGIQFAIYLLIGKWSMKYRVQTSSIVSIAWVLCWSLLVGLPILFVLALMPLPQEIVAFSLTSLLSLTVLVLGLILMVFGSLISYGLIMVSNRFRIESYLTSILLLGEPIAPIIFGALILGEPITIWYLIGGSTLILAISIIILTSKKQEY